MIERNKHARCSTIREADLIAAMRTIYDPATVYDPDTAILNGVVEEDDFPPALKQLIDTSRIRPFLNQGVNIKTMASVFAYYDLTGKLEESDIQRLKNNPLYQELILRVYDSPGTNNYAQRAGLMDGLSHHL